MESKRLLWTTGRRRNRCAALTSTGSLPTNMIFSCKITALSISKNKALIESFIEDVLNRHDLSAIESNLVS